LLSAAANKPPSKAFTPRVYYSYYSRTSIFLEWYLNEDGLGFAGQITGYKHNVDDGKGANFKYVLNSVG